MEMPNTEEEMKFSRNKIFQNFENVKTSHRPYPFQAFIEPVPYRLLRDFLLDGIFELLADQQFFQL